MLQKIFPFLAWLPSVNKDTLKSDFFAGITGAVIVLPQGVAFALIAGMPPIYGLYTAMITPIIAALFGSSWHLISGPTTAISIVVFSTVSQYAEPGTNEFVQIALIVTFLAGTFQLIMGLARMGTLVNFVSHTVVIGFTAGAALLIASSQFKHILGITIPKGSSFFDLCVSIYNGLPQTNYYALFIGLLALTTAIVLRKIWPRSPALLIALILGSLVSRFLGAEVHDIKLVGKMPASLPAFLIPEINYDNIRNFAPNAFAIALLGLIEAVAIGRSIATKTKQQINSNQEFIGQGLSNIVGSFFSSYAGSGSFTRSGVNHQSGAKTPMAAIFAAIILMVAILFVAPLTAYLPMPAMGGVILLVAYNLIDAHQIKGILKASKAEITVLTITFLSTLFLELEFAIYFGVFFSLFFYLHRTSNPSVVTMVPDQEAENRSFKSITLCNSPACPQLKIIRIDGSLFFGAVNNISQQLREITNDGTKNILMVGGGINLIDYSGAELLFQESERLHALGGKLYFCRLKKRNREFLKKSGFSQKLGEENIFPDKKTAIKEIYQQLNQEVCGNCPVKIFKEC
jgi:SulP family sulfate permease